HSHAPHTYTPSLHDALPISEIKASLDALPDNPGALAILTFYAITTNNESDARQWLTRIRRQPRVPAAQVTQLLNAYRQQFGHELDRKSTRLNSSHRTTSYAV